LACKYRFGGTSELTCPNPPVNLAAKQFFSISLAVNLLTDPSKRSFLNGRIEEEKRKKEKTAGMEKKRRTMVEVSHD
jgi:hypothetical protein